MLVSLLIALAPSLDTWAPFANKRVVDPTARTYVIVRAPKKKEGESVFGGPGEFQLVRASAEARLVENLEDRTGKVALGPREEDEIVAKGKLPVLPVDVLVSANHGFCAVETYGSMGRGRTLVSIGPKEVMRLAPSTQSSLPFMKAASSSLIPLVTVILSPSKLLSISIAPS